MLELSDLIRRANKIKTPLKCKKTNSQLDIAYMLPNLLVTSLNGDLNNINPNLHIDNLVYFLNLKHGIGNWSLYNFSEMKMNTDYSAMVRKSVFKFAKQYYLEQSEIDKFNFCVNKVWPNDVILPLWETQEIIDDIENFVNQDSDKVAVLQSEYHQEKKLQFISIMFMMKYHQLPFNICYMKIRSCKSDQISNIQNLSRSHKRYLQYQQYLLSRDVMMQRQILLKSSNIRYILKNVLFMELNKAVFTAIDTLQLCIYKSSKNEKFLQLSTPIDLNLDDILNKHPYTSIQPIEISCPDICLSFLAKPKFCNNKENKYILLEYWLNLCFESMMNVRKSLQAISDKHFAVDLHLDEFDILFNGWHSKVSLCNRIKLIYETQQISVV